MPTTDELEKEMGLVEETIMGLRVLREQLNDALDAANRHRILLKDQMETPAEKPTMAEAVAVLDANMVTSVVDLGRARLAKIEAVEKAESLADPVIEVPMAEVPHG
jgi:hypothetical protein